MLGELIGEFKGRNTAYRVLPDGKMEASAQGTGKILGIDAFVVDTAVAGLENGVFAGEENAIITTMDGDIVMMKSIAINWQEAGKGGVTRAASYNITQSQKLARLNKVIGVHEYVTDEN